MESFLFLVAALLGIKHAFDADHLVAIGNILTRAKSVPQALRLSLWWSAGHMITAGVITALLVWGKLAFWPDLLARLDILVPIMLILIGAWGLLIASRRLHAHRHEHNGRAHAHLHVHVNERHEARKMGGIGLVHGLASNDELLVILVAVLGVNSLPLALAMVGVFSLGVVAGMFAYAVAIHTTVAETRRPAVGWWANVTLSVLSIFYAGWLLAGHEGFNLLPVTP